MEGSEVVISERCISGEGFLSGNDKMGGEKRRKVKFAISSMHERNFQTKKCNAMYQIFPYPIIHIFR